MLNVFVEYAIAIKLPYNSQMPRALPISLYLVVCIVLLVGNIKIYQEIFAPRVLEVSVLEVGPPAGGGDAILVRTPNQKTLLIDTGPDASILRALGSTLPEWQRSIDVIALTSTKTSSVGGLPEVMNHYTVPTLLHFGTDIPYGTRFVFDTAHITIIAPDRLSISYGATSLDISSTTPKGLYVSDGKVFTKTK